MTALSIVTITWNNMAGLERTIASVESQTHLEDVRWIIVDGGSTDGTVDFLRGRTWTRIVPTIVSGPDGGILDAMTKGAERAEGYLNFLNAGDEYADAGVLHAASGLAQTTVEWFYGQAMVVDEGGERARPVNIRPYSTLRHAYHLTRVSHQATFMRVDIFRRLGGFDPRAETALDFDLLLRAGRLWQPVVAPDVWVKYLGGGISEVRMRRQLVLIHQSRVRIFSMNRAVQLADYGFTMAYVARSYARRWAKRLARRVGLGGLVRRWNHREAMSRFTG